MSKWLLVLLTLASAVLAGGASFRWIGPPPSP